MATYVIADLHGRADLLEAALTRLGTEPPGELVVLGDFVDRGPDSRAIIERLMAGPPPGWRWTVLFGNHEAMMVEVCLVRDRALSWWIGNGGDATLHSYGYRSGDSLHPLRVPAAHLDWLARLPTLHVDAHRVYVHAGVDPDAPLDAQRDEELIWKRYAPGDARGHGDRHVVHGHDADERHPLVLAGRTNLDARAHATDWLALGVFDDAVPGGPVDIWWVGADG